MKEKNGEHPWGDAGQLILLVVFIAVWAFDSFALRFSTGPSRFVPLAVRLALSAIVFVLSLLLIRSVHGILDHDARPSGVIGTGSFRYVRHPLYLGSMLFYLALVIATASLLSLIVLLAICLFYDFIARYEERLLAERYGDEYRAYCARTGRWFPRRAKADPV